MDGADPSELARRDDLIRRQMAERTERQGWVHHVVDGDTGEVLTTRLDRPLAPLSRAERLARLGHGPPLPDPWGPVYKLTARNPYQAAPLNWVTFYDAAITLPEAPGRGLLVASAGLPSHHRFARAALPFRPAAAAALRRHPRLHGGLLGRSGGAHRDRGIGQRPDPGHRQLRRPHRGPLLRPVPRLSGGGLRLSQGRPPPGGLPLHHAPGRAGGGRPDQDLTRQGSPASRHQEAVPSCLLIPLGHSR